MNDNKIICGDWIEVAETLPSGLVHCIITSPPYWGQRNYGVEGQLGLEKTPENHIEKLVIGFRELRRVLRDDGVVFLNYGDKYNGSGGASGRCWENGKIPNLSKKQGTNIGSLATDRIEVSNLKQGDLIGLAWRLALALQADGWYLRSDIIWAKALSFCEKYSGSTMPESVNGWRWERHKIKVGPPKAETPKGDNWNRGKEREGTSYFENRVAQWQDCPGCKKCEPNDGLVLRKGSWRPTRAHEYLFLLTKTSKYFSDMEAVREPHAEPWRSTGEIEKNYFCVGDGNRGSVEMPREYNPSGRNLRDVFCINPQAYPDAHYATFPEALVEPCIKVGTSEKGCCPKCGAQWARIVDTGQIKWIDKRAKSPRSPAYTKGGRAQGNVSNNRIWDEQYRCGAQYENITLGWRPTCKCGIIETVPCIVYDPFMGSGTVAAVAAKLGRNYLGSELNEDYVKNQAEYRIVEGETGISKDEQRAGQMALFKEGQ